MNEIAPARLNQTIRIQTSVRIENTNQIGKHRQTLQVPERDIQGAPLTGCQRWHTSIRDPAITMFRTMQHMKDRVLQRAIEKISQSRCDMRRRRPSCYRLFVSIGNHVHRKESRIIIEA